MYIYIVYIYINKHSERQTDTKETGRQREKRNERILMAL